METAYLPCPAGAAELAGALTRFTTEGGRRIALITGLSFRHADGAPDVMRGEETQIAGLGLAGTRLAVMPGTHSKWVRVEDGRITAFRTAMTGDAFAALRDHTVLKLTTAERTEAPEAFAAGVALGAAEGGAGPARQAVPPAGGELLGDFAAAETAERLSGLLIGTEIAEARHFAPDVGGPVVIVAARRWRRAMRPRLTCWASPMKPPRPMRPLPDRSGSQRRRGWFDEPPSGIPV